MACSDALQQGKVSTNLNTNMPPKPTTNKNKNSRTYSYSIKRDNCMTFIWKFSNGPWGLDSQACPTFTVLPRLCCWQVRYALEQGSINYSPQANSGPGTFFVNKVLLGHSHAYLDRLSLLLHPNGRTEELQQKPCVPQSLKHWQFGPLQKKFLDSWSKAPLWWATWVIL